MYDVLIKNARIVTADNTVYGDIAVKDGRIAAIGDICGDAEKVFDADGKAVIPGLVDSHCHIGWPDWDWGEECVSTTKAAAAGGVTTVMLMDGTEQSMFKQLKERCAEFNDNAYIDGSFHEFIYTDEHVDEIVPMATEGGITSFKFFIPYRGAEAVPPAVGIDDGIIYTGFEQIGRLTKPAIALFHPENIEIFYRLKSRILAAGGKKNLTWNDTRPNVSEVETIRRCVAFAKYTKTRLYICHMTIKEAEEEILRARAEGVEIYGETCPQYMCLNCDEADPILSKVNPPVRTKEDNEGLWKAVADGVISTVGSDHAACATKHKKEFWSAVVGFAGVQLILPVMYTDGVLGGRISLNQMVACTSTNAAKIFGIYPQKGTIEVGSDADLVILDEKKESVCHADELFHMSDFTPFEGKKLKGFADKTFCRGELVWDGKEIVGKKGFGHIMLDRKAELKE